MKTFEEIAAYLKCNVQDGDMVFILGAGDIIKLSELLTAEK